MKQTTIVCDICLAITRCEPPDKYAPHERDWTTATWVDDKSDIHVLDICGRCQRIIIRAAHLGVIAEIIHASTSKETKHAHKDTLD